MKAWGRVAVFLIVLVAWPGGIGPVARAQPGGYSPQELEDLLAPVALYPDPLLSQVLAAVTFPDQLQQAALLVPSQGPDAIASQNWEANVKAVAGYPEVLALLTGDPEWLAALGWAVMNQQQDVLAAVQRLRQRAQAAGNLASTPQQRVMVEDQVIQILPAEPNVIYVPQYDPVVVYVDRGPYLGDVAAAGLITFGIGYAIGSWVDPFDWHHSHWNYPPPPHHFPGPRPPYRPGYRPPGPGARPPVAGGRPPASGVKPPRPGQLPSQPGYRPPASRPGGRPPSPGQLPSRPPAARPSLPAGGARPPMPSQRPAAPAPRPSLRPDFGRPATTARPASGSAFGGYGRPGQAQQHSARGHTSLGATGGLGPSMARPSAPRGGAGLARGGGPARAGGGRTRGGGGRRR